MGSYASLHPVLNKLLDIVIWAIRISVSGTFKMEALIDVGFECASYALIRAKPKREFVEGALIVCDEVRMTEFRVKSNAKFGAAGNAAVGGEPDHFERV